MSPLWLAHIQERPSAATGTVKMRPTTMPFFQHVVVVVAPLTGRARSRSALEDERRHHGGGGGYFCLQDRLPFRPRSSAGRAPPTIPKCSRRRLACSFGGRSLMLSQS